MATTRESRRSTIVRLDGDIAREVDVITLDDRTVAGLGWSLALDGHRLLVGAPSGSADAYRAFLFEADPAGWSLVRVINAGTAYDDFGLSVALSEPMMAIGAPGDDEPAVDAGVVYLFAVGGDGAPTASISAETPTVSARFGTALALDGELLVVGAPGADLVEVFHLTADGALRAGSLEGTEPGSQFGASVALDSRHIVVGAPGRSAGGSERGATFLFDRTSLQPLGQLMPSESADGARFGTSIAAAANRFAVGAPGLGSPGAVFRFDSELQETRMIRGVAEQSALGVSVAMSESSLIMGAPASEENAGGLRIERSPGLVFGSGFE